MRVTEQVPIGTVMAMLRKRIEDMQSALAVLEALVAGGTETAPMEYVSWTVPIPGPGSVEPTRKRRRRKRMSVGDAAVELLRAAGRPMHGLREIVPALLADGFKIANPSGLATSLMRTGLVVRTAPGTFGLKGGGAPPTT